MRYSVFIKLLPSLVQVVGLPVGALLAYHLGLRTYRKQKSMEECRRRYLTEGLDALTKDFGRSLAAAHRNWATGTGLAVSIRLLAGERRLAEHLSVPADFESFEPSAMGLDELHRVEELLGTGALRLWFFTAQADFTAMRLFVFLDVAPLFRAYMTDAEAFDQDPGPTADHLVKALNQRLETFKRHEPLLRLLEELSRELWKAGISFESIPSIHAWPIT